MLTQKKLDSLTPKASEFCEKCGRVPGLFLRIRPSGAMSWIFRYTVNKKANRVTIGTYYQATPTAGITLKRAREIASDYRAIVEQGIDLKRHQEEQSRLKAQQARNFDDAFLDYDRVKLSKQLRPEQSRRTYERDVQPVLGHIRLADLHIDDLHKLFKPMAHPDGSPKRGKINAAYQVVRQTINHALGLGWLHHDPFPRLRLTDMGGGYGEVERNLSFAELRQLLPELKAWRTAERNRRLVRFLLASGQRASAVLEMRWSDLDLLAGVWTLPASSKERHSKSRVARRIPLSGYMLDILELQRGDVSQEVELVWPRPTNGQQMLAADVRGLIKRNLPEGMEHFTPHDLRRTFISRCNELRLDPIYIEKVTGHKLPGMMAVYNRHDYFEEQAELLEAWGHKLLELEAGNVTDLGEARRAIQRG